MTEQETVSLDDVPVELPPALEQFIGALKSDRKKLLKGKAFADGSQLQAFIGQFMYPRLIELVAEPSRLL